MRFNTKTWPVYSAGTRQNKVDPKPAYQQGSVWSTTTRQLFIDSIIRGYDVPKFYLRQIDHPDFDYEVIDGQQRLTAIWAFLGNEYALSEDSDNVKGHDIAGKTFEGLHDDLKQDFQGYELSVIVVEDASDDEIEDMFLRFQSGVPLNGPEKRNAIAGQIRDFIHETARSHRLMTRSVTFKNNRYIYDEVVAQMLWIEAVGQCSFPISASARCIGQTSPFGLAHNRQRGLSGL